MSDRSFSKKCGQCGERAVALARLDAYETTVEHDGRTYAVRIPDFVVPQCANCGTVVLDHDANDRIDTAFREAAGLLTPEEIRSNRTSLGLTQQALADALRVSVSTLSRWETGGQIQQRSLDLLMRLYFELPEVRSAACQESRGRLPV
ncbi:MAG: helix-turn-helix domain-containing protein [Gemmataceae bacterium]